MKNKIFYSYSMVNGEDLTVNNLLKSHALTLESKTAWNLLETLYKSVYGVDLPLPRFEKSGKPIIENGFISLSHSNGAVAVAFSNDIDVGVDIELIKNEVPKNLSKLLGKKQPLSFYKKWTEREAVIKAKNYSALKKGAELEFEGLTETIKILDKEYSLSLYGKNAEFIKV